MYTFCPYIYIYFYIENMTDFYIYFIYILIYLLLYTYTVLKEEFCSPYFYAYMYYKLRSNGSGKW